MQTAATAHRTDTSVAGSGHAGRAAAHALAHVAFAFVLASSVLAAPALERVTFAATDATQTRITGYLARPAHAAAKPAPAIIALHGCGGLFSKRDAVRLSARHADWAGRWTAAGYAVLFPDSYGSRGLGDVCTMKKRGINPRMRADDAFGAAAWLATQPFVDRERLALVGWSNGAGTALYANDAPLTPAVDFAVVIAFYPGCRVIAERGRWKPRRPQSILIGSADDWTPAAPCAALAATSGARLITYPGAYHDFDSPNAPLRRRTGLAYSAKGDGVAHSGTHPAARAAAISEVTRLLAGAFR
jgi:dienelactone hydrolase